jgi:hypothetical protein
MHLAEDGRLGDPPPRGFAVVTETGVSEIRPHVILSASEMRSHVKTPVSEIRTHVSCHLAGGSAPVGPLLVPLGRLTARKSPGLSIFLLRSVLSAKFSH